MTLEDDHDGPKPLQDYNIDYVNARANRLECKFCFTNTSLKIIDINQDNRMLYENQQVI